MLSESQIQQFHRDGFLIVPSVLTPEQVQELRTVLINLFDSGIRFKGDNQKLRMDICSRYPELRWLLFHPPIVSALKSLLGDDFVYLPEMAAHDSLFGPWHKDTDGQNSRGYKFQHSHDYLMVEAALYLQDNGKYGGGLDVVPGSHKHGATNVEELPTINSGRIEKQGFEKILEPLETSLLKNKGKVARMFRSIKQKPVPIKSSIPEREGEYSIPSKAGDLVLFHFHVDHKGSWPELSPIPAENRKLALFFACSSNSKHVDTYKQYLLNLVKNSEGYEYIRNHQYPEDLQKLAKEKGIRLA